MAEFHRFNHNLQVLPTEELIEIQTLLALNLREVVEYVSHIRLKA